ncbi:MAG TPA: hypothetical protein VID47_07210 [Actinomycetota bacterium]|jgi:hypothetical protein
MPRWADLSTGRRRAGVLAGNFDAAIAPLRERPSWWPNTRQYSARVVLRVREVGVERAVTDRAVRGWLLRALNEWRAGRGGAIDPSRLSRRLTAPTYLEALRSAETITLARFDPDVDAGVLAELFDGLVGIKRSEAQVVAISKTLCHLLPELIAPFDGVITCGFFDWNALPKVADQGWLADVYAVLGGIARKVGARRLERLGTPAWPLDPAVGAALRIGQGRVVDLGLEGYRRARDEPWYVP